MEVKKNPKVDLQNRKGIFLEIGLIFSLALCLVAFSVGQSKKAIEIMEVSGAEVEVELIDVTKTEEPKPQAPVKQAVKLITNMINIVDNETKIEEEVDFIDFTEDEIVVEEIVVEEEIVEVGKRTAIDLGIHGLHPELIRLIGKMKYRSSYGQNLLQHARETANLAGIMAAELGLNPKAARRAGLLHDIGKVPDDEPELPHAIIGQKLAEKYKEKADVCNAIGAHHDETEMTSMIAPIIQVCDAISGARPGARREVIESYIKRLKEMEDIALSYEGVVKTYAIQAGRELRVIVGADKLSDAESEALSHDIAKRIQDEMTYPGQVKITVIRETRSVSYAK